MDNKLHIFGCSHSTDYNIDYHSSWPVLLKEKLNLNLYKRFGQSGMGINNICFDAMERIFLNQIKKDDYVILNTSYSTRFSTINLFEIDNDKNIYFSLIKDVEPKTAKMMAERWVSTDFMNGDLIRVIQWVIITKSLYDILKKYSDNVYIWFLEDLSEINEIISYYDNNNKRDIPIGIDNFELKHIRIDNKNFENIIEPPFPYKMWNDWIIKNSIKGNSHMNLEAHNKFSDYLYEFIKKSRK